MRRGEIWWAYLDEPAGERPVVLISREKAIQVRNAVTVALLSTKIRNIPVEVMLTTKEGLPKPCVINCDNIETIPKTHLFKKLTTLNHEKMVELNDTLKFALGLA